MSEQIQEDISNAAPRSSARGPFLTKGMLVSIPKGGLTLKKTPEGGVKGDPLILHLGLDVCPYWLKIAFNHLQTAETSNKEVLEAHKANANEPKADALNREFIHGMQAIVASGIAMDAFYASVKDHVDLPSDLIRAWSENSTARYKQVAELLRRAFPMSEGASTALRDVLKQNATFRDMAVHPASGTTAPTWHPELRQATAWQYVTFRFFNAKNITGLTLSIVAQLAAHPRQEKYDTLRKYCSGLSEKLLPLIEQWEQTYGQLYESPPQHRAT